MQYLDIISKVKDCNTFYNLAIIESVYDADNQERLFSLNNMDVVSNLGIPEYTVLIEAINKLNGWDSVGASNQKNLKKVK
jgi:hypothetical protein